MIEELLRSGCLERPACSLANVTERSHPIAGRLSRSASHVAER